MAYNILNLKQDLVGVIHGTQLNKIVNLNGIINRAARQVLQDIDPQETKRILPFATPIFQGALSYFLAPDVKGNAIIDIYPQVNRLPGEVFNQSYNQEFSLSATTSWANQFTIQWNQGVRSILVSSPFQPPAIILNYASSLDDNGTWVLGGDATNLQVNPVNFLAGGGALMFDLNVDGDDIVVNGNFNGNDSGWIVGSDWTYGTNKENFSFGPNGGIYALGLGNNTPGTGYIVGDILTLTSGDGNAQIKVLDVDGSGGITNWDNVAFGTGYTSGTDTNVSGGAGTGAIFLINFVLSDGIQQQLSTIDEGIYTLQLDAVQEDALNSVVVFAINEGQIREINQFNGTGTFTQNFGAETNDILYIAAAHQSAATSPATGSVTNISVVQIPSGGGYIETSNMQAVDLTDAVNFATQFLYTSLPTASVFSSVALDFGSSPTDFYSFLTSLTQAQTAFANGWNLLSYPWNSPSVTGTPDPSSITYLRVVFNYDTTPQFGVMINDISSNLGQIFLYEYYSKYMFADAITGAFQETVTDDSNLINLDTDSYNILFNQVAYLVAQQLQGLDAEFFDANFFLQNYQQDVQRYKGLYKSEKQKPRQTYYGLPRPGYSSWLPRRWNQ